MLKLDTMQKMFFSLTFFFVLFLIILLTPLAGYFALKTLNFDFFSENNSIFFLLVYKILLDLIMCRHLGWKQNKKNVLDA